MSELKKEKIPSYLLTPPSIPNVIHPPTSKLQELPFNKIEWESFEKLCLRLARDQSSVEFCRLYGVHGDNQKGIDLYARSSESDKYIVYQCKREKNYGPRKIKKALKKFLNEDWVDKTGTFVLCTSESLRSQVRTDEIERQRVILDKKGIKLEVWDEVELSTILKSNPELVNDFFGEDYVELFNGKEIAEQLKPRLDVQKLSELRDLLKSLYEVVFTQHDPGIPTFSITHAEGITITERFIEPDIFETRQFDSTYSLDNEEKDRLGKQNVYDRSTNYETSQERLYLKSEEANYKQRISLSEWLGRNNKSIILGTPGSGKSTFLRFLALDLLNVSPTLENLAQKWGGYIPVWLPFGHWTKIIEESPNSECSLSELLQKWLKNLDEDRIWPLLEQALEDERLLLLVDGMDEWTDENSGIIAVDRLQVFVKQRNIPAIVTSRPHGYTKLKFQDLDWQLGSLADFNKKQQVELVDLWFRLWKRSIKQSAKRIQSDIDSFIRELQRTSDLQDLARTPLFLSLLITLRIQNARLPANRFLAYQKLVELLITTHPKRRKQAATVKDVILQKLTNDELKDILSHLAYYILETHLEGIIEVSIAIDIIERFLKDEEYGLGFNTRDAKKLSREIVDVGQSDLGIIVQVSQYEIGFLHRTILQYLAAYSLAQFSREQQYDIILKKCTNLQWFETILALFYLTRQKEDLKWFIESINKLKVNKLDERKIQLLLSEVAFGDFKCPPAITKKLTNYIFNEIELGSWMPHRERLLQRALSGLQSSKVKDQVEAKVHEWFPSRNRWRPSLYEAMCNWPPDEHTLNCLLHGLHDEELVNKRAAGKAILRLFSKNNRVLNKLISLALGDVNINTKVAAIEVLISGWPEEEKTKKIIANARQSFSPVINLLGIYGLIKTNNIDSKLEADVFKLFDKFLGYEWNDLLVKVILEGWPKAESFKKAALDSLTMLNFQQRRINREVAYQVLITGYQGDSDVVDFIANEIDNEEFPFNVLMKGEAWNLLKENFKNESKIIKAVEKNRVKFKHDPIALSYSALIGCTQKDKNALINCYKNNSFPFWAASALLEGWGTEDDVVMNLLERDVWGEARRSSQIGYLLPQIIIDKEKCKKRLLEILKSGKKIRYDFVTEGLVHVAKGENDKAIVDSLIEVINEQDAPGRYLDTAKAKLIIYFNKDKRVKEIALKEFKNREGNINSVAIGFAGDISIRQQIIKLANPLPRQLRAIIVERLSEQLGDLNFRKKVLSKYDFESETTLKTQASIGYYNLLETENLFDESHLDYLKETIVCYGPDHDERRQAAFCGLTILKRLDILFDVDERIGKDKNAKISIGDYSRTNVPLLNEIFNNWEYIKKSLGDELIPRLSKNTTNEQRIWEALSLVADSYPNPRSEILQYIEDNLETVSSSLIFINFVARVLPQSNLLLKLCLKNISSNKNENRVHYEDTSLRTAHILANHFKEKKAVLNELLSMEMNTRVFYALLMGWNESIDIENVFQENQQQIFPNAIIEANLKSKEESKEIVINWMKHLLEKPIAPYILKTNLFWQPIIERFQKDSKVVDVSFEVLKKTDNSHLKVSLSHLIYKSDIYKDKFIEWGIDQINNQLNDNKISEDGFDLLSGDYRSLLQVLYQVFDSEIEQSQIS